MNWHIIRERLYAFVIKRVDNEQIAEDVVQDILLKAVEKFDSLQEQEKFLPWLYQIGRNTIIDHYRRSRPMHAFSETIRFESDEKIESALQELEQCIQPLLDKLPDIYRDVLIQAHFGNKKLREIADDENISLVAVKSRVQRGRQQLKSHLLACCSIQKDHLGNISDVTYPQNCTSC